VLVELLFFPGVTIVAALGVALMLGSALFAMIDYFPGDPVIPSPELLLRPALNLTIALVVSTFVIAMLARFFPSMPGFRRVILPAAVATGPSIAAPAVATVGDLGVARSILRPAGKAEIAGALVDVVTEGEFLEAGSPLRVLAVEGGRVMVGRA
jgi:membrane-bound serine protease (ClpP class)